MSKNNKCIIKNRYSISRLLILIVGLLVVSGCSSLQPQFLYFHNAENNQEMQRALTKWNEYQDANSGFWPTLLRNQDRMALATISGQLAIQDIVQSTSHRAVLSSTWSELIKEMVKWEGELDVFNKKLEDGRLSNSDLLNQTQKNIKKLVNKNKGIKEQLTAAQLARQRWQGKLYLLERGVQEALVREASKRQGLEVKKPADFLAKILKEKIIVYDENGNPAEKELAELLKGDEDLKKVSMFIDPPKGKEWLEFVGKVRNNGISTGFSEPPGLDYDIIALGTDLARAQLERAHAVERAISEEKTLFDQRSKQISDARKWIDNFNTLVCQEEGVVRDQKSNFIISCTISKALQDKEIGDELHENKVLITLNKILKKDVKSTEMDMQGLLNVLTWYILVADTHNKNEHLFNIRLAALRHKQELMDSAINAQERESFLRRGLDALATYHSGGITEEEVATLISAAQFVALSVIAGGI